MDRRIYMFFFSETATTEIYTLSLHDALPIYVWKVVEAAYFQPAPSDRSKVTEAPFSMLAPIWILTAANVYFGIDTRLPIGLAGDAARYLLEIGG